MGETQRIPGDEISEIDWEIRVLGMIPSAFSSQGSVI
jgi:hypothetical protein